MKKITNEEFQEIYYDKDLRNNVASAHRCCDRYGTFQYLKSFWKYPAERIVTPYHIARAKEEKRRMADKTAKEYANSLLFIGMGVGVTDTLEKYYDTSVVNNCRFRTQFLNDEGDVRFLEFTLGASGDFYLDHFINRTTGYGEGCRTEEEGRIYISQTEPHKSIVDYVNKMCSASFTEMHIDNHDLAAPNKYKPICYSPNAPLDSKGESFSIPDEWYNCKIEDTHFYKWMFVNCVEDYHFINDKRNYLRFVGFKIGLQSLTSRSVDTIKFIEDYYYRTVLKPKFKRIGG